MKHLRSNLHQIFRRCLRALTSRIKDKKKRVIEDDQKLSIMYIEDNDDDPKEFSDDAQPFYLPEVLLLAILYRLPVKSIFICKCVCKHWFSLITHPDFFPGYISQFQGSPPWTLLFQYDSLLGLVPIPPEYMSMYFVTTDHPGFNNPAFLLPRKRSPRSPPLEIIASCNDLLLCRSEYGPQGAYCVRNPFTKQCVTIPRPPTYDKCIKGFVCRTSNGITSYRVVLIKKPTPNKGFFHCDIFSSETGEWKSSKMRNFPVYYSFDDVRRCISYNGCLHWVDRKFRTLLAYDPYKNTHQCRYLEIPRRALLDFVGRNVLLGVCQGQLRYFEMIYTDQDLFPWYYNVSMNQLTVPSWNLWVLDDYQERHWRLVHSAKEKNIVGITLSTIFTHPGLLIPIAFHPWNVEIIYFWCEGYILSYNVRKNWFDDEVHCLPVKSMIAPWTTFPLLLPSCPTQIPDPCWIDSSGHLLSS